MSEGPGQAVDPVAPAPLVPPPPPAPTAVPEPAAVPAPVAHVVTPADPKTAELARLLDGGLGTATAERIAVLPPIEQLDLSPKLSPRTGEPERPVWLVVALGFLYAAALVGAVTLAMTWWRAIHMPTFDHAARIIELLDPRTDPATQRYAGTWPSILAAILLVATGVIVTAAPWLAAFNAWEGRRWARVFGVVCVPISGLAWFLTTGRPTFAPPAQWLTWVPWLALPLCLIGAALLWAPPVGRFFADFIRVRAGVRPAAPPTKDVAYGPLDRYR